MPEILFVHGTGVRKDSYVQTLAVVRKQADGLLGGAKVRSCLWGEPLGARLNAMGASIPTYREMQEQKPSTSEAERVEQAAWQMLGEDLLFEIRILEYLPANSPVLGPFDSPTGEVSLELLQNLKPQPALVALLQEKSLEGYWNSALEALANNPELSRILRSVNREPLEISRALARALVAGILSAAAEDDHASISLATREQLVDLLVPDLGGRPLAPFDFISKPLFGLAKRKMTDQARRKRRAISDAAFPGAGDIVLYQARGEKIRGFIRDRILEAEDDVVVMAHSLGGIATVDLLIQEDLSHRVKGLVTLGSQAPFLYEINALTSLPYGKPLPGYFPKHWLNIWDPNDFLSYIGAGVFGAQAVKDFRVESGLAFPESHSAYWDQPEVWAEIQRFFSWP